MVTVNVHVQDETIFKADKISDFVSFRVGGDVDLFIMNSEQAKALLAAAIDAVEILKEMETAKLPSPQSDTDRMLEAGEAWLKSCGTGLSDPLSIMLGWDVGDWDVVLNRHFGNNPTGKMVYEFRAKYDQASA